MNQKGSVIIIALGICTLLILGLMAVFTVLHTSLLGQRTGEQDALLVRMEWMLDSLLKNEASCRLALGGPAVYGGPAGAPAQSYNPATGSDLKIYANDGVSVFLDPADPARNTFGPLTIDSIRLLASFQTISVPLRLYWAPLEIIVSKSGGFFGSTQIMATAIRLVVQLDAGSNIVSCSSLSFLSQDGVSQFPIPSCQPGEALFSNGVSVRCATSVCLPPNPTVLGYQANGDILCGP